MSEKERWVLGEPVPFWAASPPGLKELAAKHDLPEWAVERLLEAYGTIRGKRPDTLEEWETIYNAVKPYLDEEAKRQ